MIHEPIRRLTPKAAFLYAAIAIFGVAAVYSIFAIGVVLGLLFCGVVGYVAYHVVKFLRLQNASYLETYEHGISGRTALGERVDLTWGEISHAGTGTDHRGRHFAFIYREEDDTLLTLPEDYSHFDEFVEELQRHFELREYQLEPGESLERRLQLEMSGDKD